MSHGDPPAAPAEVLAVPDAGLRAVFADLSAWRAAHPCGCDAMCECDECVVLVEAKR